MNHSSISDLHLPRIIQSIHPPLSPHARRHLIDAKGIVHEKSRLGPVLRHHDNAINLTNHSIDLIDLPPCQAAISPHISTTIQTPSSKILHIPSSPSMSTPDLSELQHDCALHITYQYPWRPLNEWRHVLSREQYYIANAMREHGDEAPVCDDIIVESDDTCLVAGSDRYFASVELTYGILEETWVVLVDFGEDRPCLDRGGDGWEGRYVDVLDFTLSNGVSHLDLQVGLPYSESVKFTKISNLTVVALRPTALRRS